MVKVLNGVGTDAVKGNCGQVNNIQTEIHPEICGDLISTGNTFERK